MRIIDMRNIPLDELVNEIERRKKLEELEKPQMLKEINLAPIKQLCKDYISDLEREGYADEDYAHWFFETVMEVFYGKDIWKWINAQQ